jgi:hypothetical protein
MQQMQHRDVGPEIQPRDAPQAPEVEVPQGPEIGGVELRRRQAGEKRLETGQTRPGKVVKVVRGKEAFVGPFAGDVKEPGDQREEYGRRPAAVAHSLGFSA